MTPPNFASRVRKVTVDHPVRLDPRDSKDFLVLRDLRENPEKWESLV